jgi:hypothetical protein
MPVWKVFFCHGMLCIGLLLTSCTSESTVEAKETQKLYSKKVILQHSIFGLEEGRYTPEWGLNVIPELNPAWLRRNGVIWSEIEPNEGERNWNSHAFLDEELKIAAELGLDVILIVRSTPLWAQAIDGVYCGPIREDKLKPFSDFMHDLVARYSAPPYNVHTWELWNEPDVDPALVKPTSGFGCWGDPSQPRFGGEYYAEMLKTVYPKIKQADPSSQVLIGGLLLDCDPGNPPETSPDSGVLKDCASGRFLEGILDNGGEDFFDGVSFHAYDYYLGSLGQFGNPNWHSSWDSTGPVTVVKAKFINQQLANFEVAGKFLMNTEQALLCGGTPDICQSESFEITKASFVTKSYGTAMAEGLVANIWFSLMGWRGSGLLDGDLNPTLAFLAYQFAARELGAAHFVHPITQYPGVVGQSLRRGSTAIWILWSIDGSSQAVELPNTPVATYNLYGERLSVSKTLEVTNLPLYVYWDD